MLLVKGGFKAVLGWEGCVEASIVDFALAKDRHDFVVCGDFNSDF